MCVYLCVCVCEEERERERQRETDREREREREREMLDAFYVFSTGGLLLFTWRRGVHAAELKGNALDLFAEAVLVGETGSAGRPGASAAASGEQAVRRWTPTSAQVAADCYAAKYSIDNRRGLVYVAFYQRLLAPEYADKLVESVRAGFVRACMKRSPPPRDEYDTVELWRVAFDGKGCEWYQDRFEALLEKIGGRAVGGSTPKSNHGESGQSPRRMFGTTTTNAAAAEDDETTTTSMTANDDAANLVNGEHTHDSDFVPDAAALEKLKRRGKQQDERKKEGGGGGGSDSPKRKPRAKKVWHLHRFARSLALSLSLSAILLHLFFLFCLGDVNDNGAPLFRHHAHTYTHIYV